MVRVIWERAGASKLYSQVDVGKDRVQVIIASLGPRRRGQIHTVLLLPTVSRAAYPIQPLQDQIITRAQGSPRLELGGQRAQAAAASYHHEAAVRLVSSPRPGTTATCAAGNSAPVRQLLACGDGRVPSPQWAGAGAAGGRGHAGPTAMAAAAAGGVGVDNTIRAPAAAAGAAAAVETRGRAGIVQQCEDAGASDR